MALCSVPLQAVEVQPTVTWMHGDLLVRHCFLLISWIFFPLSDLWALVFQCIPSSDPHILSPPPASLLHPSPTWIHGKLSIQRHPLDARRPPGLSFSDGNLWSFGHPSTLGACSAKFCQLRPPCPPGLWFSHGNPYMSATDLEAHLGAFFAKSWRGQGHSCVCSWKSFYSGHSYWSPLSVYSGHPYWGKVLLCAVTYSEYFTLQNGAAHIARYLLFILQQKPLPVHEHRGKTTKSMLDFSYPSFTYLVRVEHFPPCQQNV